MQNNDHGPNPPRLSSPISTTGNNPPPHVHTDTRTQATRRGHATRREYPLQFKDFSISSTLVETNQVAQPPQNPSPNTHPQHTRRELNYGQFSIAKAVQWSPPPPSRPYRSFSPLEQEDSEIDEENEENDDVEMLEDECGADQNASRFLAQEAPYFTRDSTVGGEGRTYGRMYSDHDDNRLPRYTSRPETRTRSSFPIPSWLPDTEIVVAAKNRSFEMDNLKLQNQVIRKVLKRAFEIGKLHMLVDDMYCPLNDELKNIAFDALVEACHQLGRDAENDVLGRLQAGDHDRFIKPVVTMTSHRIGLERKDLKLSQMSSVLSAYNLVNDPALGRDRALRYITAYSYHCGTLPSGVCDRRKPFECAALPIYIGAMFFGAHPYAAIIASNKHVFKSSIASKPNELELPKGMVAISVAAIHSILSDFARQCKENFPSKELAGVWQGSLDILKNIEQVNKNHYHALMHSLYLKSSGSLPLANHSLTNRQIFESVDWSAIADDQGSPSNNTTVPVSNAVPLAASAPSINSATPST
ncbi:hypothetical protein K435DRAFT_965632 [Dendrothele bispora CBS 962.96]|nr:hypothetical protein K435DRAFT_965632 [Dendrothele bispora CBS 962.96]